MDNIFAWIDYITDYLGLPQGLLAMIGYQENGRSWNWRNVTSPRGARGIMQLMPIAIQDIYRISGFIPNPANIIHSIYGAGIYLKWLYKYFGDWRMAIAAYNWGLGNVKKNIRTYGYFNENVLPKETKNYMFVADMLGF